MRFWKALTRSSTLKNSVINWNSTTQRMNMYSVLINQYYKAMITYKEINEYKQGDTVEVLVNNPRNENLNEWREAEVLDKRMIYPKMNYERFTPYPILIVRVKRTYCKATPVYRFIGNIPVFVDNNLEFYDRENDEGVLYSNQIRLKT